MFEPTALGAGKKLRMFVAIGLGVDAYRESRQLAFDPQTEKILKAAPKRPGYEGTGLNHPEDYT